MKKALTVVAAMALSASMSLTSYAADVKVGIVLNSFDSTMSTMKTLFETACDAEGYDYVTLNSNSDVSTELNNMESVVSQGVDAAIIMGCDGEGSVAAVAYAASAGVPVIICGRRIAAEEDDYYVYLAGNHEEAGKAQGEYVNNYLEENPDEELNVCIIRGTSGNAAVESRYQGFYDTALEGEYKDRINILVDLYGEYDATKANSIASDALTANPDLNCFITMSDDMASGIISAIQAAGKNPEDYLILSVDLSNVGQGLLEDGTLTGTVMMNMKSMADQAAEYVKKAVEGEKPEEKNVTVEGYYQMALADTYKQMLEDAGMN
jgi:ribose transport system substrate-binding protein